MVKGTHRGSVKDGGPVRLLGGAETSRRGRAMAPRRRQPPHDVGRQSPSLTPRRGRQSPSAIALFLSKKGKHVRREAGLPRARRVSNATSRRNRLGSVALTLEKLRQITNNFSDDQLIGEGAFGKVYKGVLTNGDVIAVKRFASTIAGLQDVQYENEARHLMRLKHPNIVQLVGYCSETELKLARHNGTFVRAEKAERLLCLEYLQKGSLRDHLSDATSGLLNGTHATKLLRAFVMVYIIFMRRDFGLSRLFGEEQTRTCTTSRKGTLGYMAPEYVEKGVITKKFDIFSLGVIIIQIITGLKEYPTDETETASKQYIDLVLNNWRHRFTKAQGYTSQDIDCQQIKKCIQIGLLSVKFDPVKRPTISQIIKMLERSDEAYQNEREVSFSGASHPANMYTQEDLPKQVSRTLYEGSNVMSLDFHPVQQTILLVGTNIGDIVVWEVGSRERIAHETFKVWDIGSCTLPLQASLMKDAAISVNRCLWSPDGTILGVAFSKHIVQTYTFVPNGDLRQQAEIDAHIGGVNDIAFSHPNKTLSIITCGDDKLIKVWDAQTGQKQYTFEGHEAPVYSVCPHYKESIQFIFSTAIDGKIKAWLYDCLGSRVDYDAPGHWCTTMAYSADGTRLFSCGTSKEGDSHLVEWNETEGAIKRTYNGFRKRSLGVVQFDTTRNRFLAAGDEFLVKFWDMDNNNILTTTDCDGGLPASPRLRFNREGSLLAVTTSDNGIKILANTDGQRLLRMLESRAFEGSRGPPQQINTKPPIVALGPVSNVSSPIAVNAERPDRILPAVSTSGLAPMDASRTPDVKPRITDECEKVKTWKLADIVDHGHLRALHLTDTDTNPSKVVRLLYTNNGIALLALGSNAVHKLWKWQRNDRNPSGKSTASVPPHLWQPANGILMTNDTNDGNPEEATACIALSKNDSYVMSASGGKVSLFNMMTFKVMTTFMAPPPAATFLAFHPQDNNIIAIGMEDSTIQIYNVRIDDVKSKLKGHQKKITGLAFSQSMNVLVSSGADAQLCVWSIDGWEKKKSRYIQPPANRPGTLVGDTRVQFHNDQTHLLVVHESQLAIYDGNLECLRSWSPRDALPAPISSAIYSCDGLLVYAAFCDGAIGVFEAESLRLRCRIAPSAYIPPSILACAGRVYPLVVAAHPMEPNQIALGMSDGKVHVVEPLDGDPKWGTVPPQDNGAHPAISAAPSAATNQASDQPTR